MRWLAVLLVVPLLLPATPVLAQEEPDIEFFYPVVTRRPVIERELELRTRFEKASDGKQLETAGAIEWPILPRWQVELEIPVVVDDPSDGKSQAGFGDISIENKFLFWKSVEQRLLVSGGFELTLPSGSASRGLGGELAVEPFVTAGIALGPLDLLGSIAYEWVVNGEAPREQEFTWNVALGYPISRWFTPFVEMNSVLQTAGSGSQEEGEANLVGRVQLYLTPGFNVRPLPGMTFRAGVELPVTSARQFNYAVHAGLVWEF
jgi:hypothetical protein